ncbi:SRPBCC family protein [Paraconexibacter antarcticus]|uniref:SRPBCC family protein n=1 Tax=Paraconexibacter antarcticus TaxID=2949664 RepID=A0ABY5DRI4_9ACTN|nr:SRPBCC family protein [Paraconexibacter antarcticus]UTI63422.1 SRPBCC family protein [Paraconexibacter antarcticus]
MNLEQTFTVAASPETVWEALIDVERVAPCLPGAAVTGREEDGSYKGEFKVKLGPTTAAYSGVLKMKDVDAEQKVATMDARGTDKRGQGGATASIVSSVHAGEKDGETRVDVVTDFAITGRLARFGRGGMVQDVANRLLREFAANLQAQLAAEGAAVAAGAPPEGAGATPEEVAAAADADAAPGLGAAGAATGSAPQPPPRPARPAAATPPPAAAPVSGTAIMLGALGDRLRREPVKVGAMFGVLGLLLVLLRRRR